jgi:glycosyltransferase involved in cell wall biosynthesis
MATGCCVLGSSVGGIPELITQGEDGLVFARDSREELVESLRLLLADEALRTRLRTKAVDTASRRFSMERTLERTQLLYETLLERKLGMRERAAAQS